MNINSTVKKALQIVLSFAIGILIFYLVYKDQDIGRIKEELSKCNLKWLLISIVLGALSHFIRALRWRQLIEPLGKKPRLINTFFAVMTGYFANYLIPRAGEAARCGVLKKYEDISFSSLLGTVIAERAFDLIVLICFVLAALLTNISLFSQIFAGGTILDSILGLLSNPIVIILIIITIGFVYIIYCKLLKKSRFTKKGKEFLQKIWQGVKTFFLVKNKPLFIFYSIIIWLFYFNMSYLCFNAFDFSQNLGLDCGLSSFAIGSLGIVAPVQGGIGAWHYLTIETLKFYGVAAIYAATFAFVVHLAQTIMILVLGFISFVLLPIINKK